MRASPKPIFGDVLPCIEVPTLVLYGEKDVRAPKDVWGPLHERIRRSKLALKPDVGHMIGTEAAERSNIEVRAFLLDVADRNRWLSRLG